MEQQPASTPNEDNEAKMRGLNHAFEAYLELPDIDRSDPAAINAFSQHYVGSYPSMDSLLEELTELTEWEAAIEELATTYGIEGVILLDRNRLESTVRAIWDIVGGPNYFHVFNK